MIRYALKCEDGHGFESWFQSASAFDALAAAGHLACPHCGSSKVEKSLMAPRVASKEARAAEAPAAPESTEATPHPPEAEAARKLAELRDHVEKTSDYVGDKFATEARAMHEGTTPERAIYGEAKPQEAIKLIEEGVPIAPLPFIPKAKTN